MPVQSPVAWSGQEFSLFEGLSRLMRTECDLASRQHLDSTSSRGDTHTSPSSAFKMSRNGKSHLVERPLASLLILLRAHHPGDEMPRVKPVCVGAQTPEGSRLNEMEICKVVSDGSSKYHQGWCVCPGEFYDKRENTNFGEAKRSVIWALQTNQEPHSPVKGDWLYVTVAATAQHHLLSAELPSA
jgi:hypothetical protein